MLFFRKVDDSEKTIKDTPPSQFIATTIFKDSSWQESSKEPGQVRIP